MPVVPMPNGTKRRAVFMRIDIIDGVRGHLLMQMTLWHVLRDLDLPHWHVFHHQTLFGVLDAEFFVAVSGFLVGMIGFRKPGGFASFAVKRLRVVAVYYLICLAPVILLTRVLARDGGLVPALEAILRGIALQNAGFYAEVLMIYLVCFVQALVFARLFGERMDRWLAASGALWLAGQIADMPGMFGLVGGGQYFNFAAWQLLFIAAIALGRRAPQAAAAIRAIPAARRGAVFVLCLGLSLTLAAMDLWSLARDTAMGPRSNLSPVWLLQTALICAAVAIPLLSPERGFAAPRRALEFYFRLPILRRIGAWSIQAFTLHVLLISFLRLVQAQAAPVEARERAALLTLLVFVSLMQLYARLREKKAAGIQSSSALRLSERNSRR